MKFQTILFVSGAAAAAASPAAAVQQFQHQVGLIPGTARWTEGVEATDVDNDGDIDIFFADGEGFTSAGTQRQCVLLINQFIENGSVTLSFTDESVARLGVQLSNGKGVTTADITGDGYVDALFSNAFNTDTPFLFINQGAGNPGFFNMESAARGLTATLSSGGAMFADVDNDGDLDLMSTANYLGGGAGAPRLYLNNGSGVFTQDLVFSGSAPAKSSHMDVQMVDIDNDFDVDFFGPNRASNAGGNHYLMLNNGAGGFSDSSSVLGASSANVYEADVGDLDFDQDIDLFFISLSGFAEGAQRNNLIGLGSLTFTNQAGLGGDDDNEVAFYDYDMDGDYDAFVGSLGPREKLWRNDGSLTFSNQSASANGITAVSDSTLDCTIADLNNDGRYDFISAQGESNAAQWANKVYLNVTGPVDTAVPTVVAVNSPPTALATGPVVVRMKVRDQVLDDGVDYVTANSRYRVLTSPAAQAVSINAGNFSPASVSVPVGTTVTWTNNSGVNQNIVSQSFPFNYSSGGPIAPAGTYAFTYVTPGTYNYQSTLGGFSGTITVTGSAPTVGTSIRAGIALHRFSFADTAGGTGVELGYECEFTDWQGNSIIRSGKVNLVPNTCPSAFTYCTPKLSSSGCSPVMGSSGVSSLAAPAGFQALASQVEASQNGLAFFGTTGQTNAPFFGGTLCVNTPLYRLGIKNSGGAGACTGAYAYSLAEMLAEPSGGPLLVVGQNVNVQVWFRDPPDAQTVGLTNGLQFQVCP